MNPLGALMDYLPHVVVLLVLYYAYRKVSLPGFSMDALLSRFRAPDHLAQRELRAGNLQGAGRIFEELGMPDKAVEAYVKGGEDWAAAAVLEGQRKFDRAGQLYQQAGDRKKAAEMFERGGKPAKAAALHLEDGNNLEAARLRGVSGDWRGAAELFLKSGYPLRAAEAFERLGESLQAAKCYEAHFTENVTYSTTFSGGVPSKERRNARRAGELYKAAGQLERAREMFARGEFFKEAALVSLELGDFARAGEHFSRAEELTEAARAFEQAGDMERAANLLGEVAFKENRIPEAAALFRDGKDYLRAAELFESVDMLAEAAAAFEAGESFPAAAGVYIRAGLPARAAEAFERGGAYEDAARLYDEIGDGARAAELFERAGQTFKSGLAAADAGDTERAIRLLQKVPPEDESYRAASERLGQLFVAAGRPGLAVERLSKLLSGQTVSVANLELAYWLARAHEARGEHPSAQSLYKKILAEDMSFRDVNARLGAAPPGSPPGAPQRPASGSFVAPPRSAAGDVVGKYRIGHALGEGAMGRVYAARDTVLERDVALKLMVTADDADMRQRFEREARAVARMTHPNVVTVYDLGQGSTGQAYIAMELLRGSDLRQAMRTAPAIRTQLERKIAVILQVLDGLAHAHAAGIVHRDIKPANVFICHDGVVKIMDFGVARLTSGSMTGTGAVVGTADYMSPEQVSGAAVSGASDLFSVGVMLYELLVGRPPFRADSLMATFYGITHREPDYTPIDKAGLAPLRRLLQRALAKKVSERYATAAEFAADLKELLRERSQATGRSMEQLLDLSGTLVGAEAAKAAAWESSGDAPTAPPARESSGSAPTQPPAAGRPRAPAPLPRPAPPPRPAGSGAAPVTSARFELERELGRGLLGVVYSAHDRASGKRLALRMLPPPTAATAAAHEHLLEDLKAAGRLAHPGIARVLGIDYPSGGTAVLTELVEWPTLEAAVAARTRPTAADAVAIGRALAAALSFAHSKGVVHGSIKPSNVMTGRPHKIVDTGLGRLYAALDADSPYRAPERRLDAAADVFGLGGVLFFMLTGKAPPEANPRPGRHGASVPDALDELVADCLAAEPARRIHSPEGILKRFDAMLAR